MLSRRAAWAVALVATLTMTVSYVDRSTLAVLAPTICKQLDISESAYGWLTASFSLAYLVATPFAGVWLDQIGARRGLVWSVLAWSIAAALHAVVPGFGVLLVLRIALGTAEGPGFPAAAQTMHRILPPADRTRGFGVLFTGSSIGSMLAPPLASALYDLAGWRVAFLGTAALGLLWIPLWIWLTRPPATAAQLDHPAPPSGGASREGSLALDHPAPPSGGASREGSLALDHPAPPSGGASREGALALDHTAPPSGGASREGSLALDHPAPPFGGASREGSLALDHPAPPSGGASREGALALDHPAPPSGGASREGSLALDHPAPPSGGASREGSLALDHAARPSSEPRPPRPPLLDLMREPLVLRALAAVFATAPVLGLVAAWGAKYLVRAHALGQGEVGHYLWLPPLGLDVGAVLFGDLAARRRRRSASAPSSSSSPRALFAVAALLAASIGLLPLAATPWQGVIVFTFASAGGGAIYALVTADLLGRMPPHVVSAVGGVIPMGQSLALFIANPLIGLAVDRTGSYTLSAIAVATWFVPGALLWWAWRPSPGRALAA